MKEIKTRTNLMHYTAACLLAQAFFAASAPAALPEHLGDAHLQRVLNWTDAQRQAASLAAKKLQAEMDAAIKAGSKSFRIPAGDYTDWLAPDQGNTGGHRCILSVVGAKDMRIEATGATFWKSSVPGLAVVFADCKNCTVQGITADMLQSPFVQGIVSEIIPKGPNVHKVITDLEKGCFPAELMSKDNFGCGRTWIMRKDGRVRANPWGFGPADEKNPPGKRAWLYYGDLSGERPAVEVGDRLAQHVMNGCGGVAVNGCDGTKFEDLTGMAVS